MKIQSVEQIQISLTLRKLCLYPLSCFQDRLAQPVLATDACGAGWTIAANDYYWAAVRIAEADPIWGSLADEDATAVWTDQLHVAVQQVRRTSTALRLKDLKAWSGGLHWDLSQPCGLCDGLGSRLPRNVVEAIDLHVESDELVECSCSYEFEPRALRPSPSFRGRLLGRTVDRIHLRRLLELFAGPSVLVSAGRSEGDPVVLAEESFVRLGALASQRNGELRRDSFDFVERVQPVTCRTLRHEVFVDCSTSDPVR